MLNDREWLLLHAKGERLKRLLLEVWYRLPERDRDVLRGALEIENAPTLLPSDLFAGCGWQYQSDSVAGYTIHVMFGDSVESDEQYSDAAIRFIIAHELAHAVLRHPMLKQLYMRHGGQQDQTLSEYVFEDHANLQVLTWGFKHEMIAINAIDPDRMPPWFILALNDSSLQPKS